MPWRLDQQNYLAWMRRWPAESVALVITDPPYSSLERHRAKGTTTRLKKSKASSNIWFPTIPDSAFPELFWELFRIMRKQSHGYIYSDPRTQPVIRAAAEAAGFYYWNTLIWLKTRMGMGYHYRRRYEQITFIEKRSSPCLAGNDDPRGHGRQLADLGISDVIEADAPRDGYPTEKPESIADLLIRQSTDPGDTVIDIFSGSGSTGVATIKAGRRFAGCDVQDEAIIAGGLRMAAIEKPGMDFPAERGVRIKRPRRPAEQRSLFDAQ